MHGVMPQYFRYIICQNGTEERSYQRIKISQPEPVHVPGSKLKPLPGDYAYNYLEYLRTYIYEHALSLVLFEQRLNVLHIREHLDPFVMSEIYIQRQSYKNNQQKCEF